MLEARVIKRRGDFRLEAALAVPTPGVIALFGRSGCGKTTLVEVISGLLPPDEGRIVLDGEVLAETASQRAVPVERRRIGYVFQDARLFPHLSVLANLRYGERRVRTDTRPIRLDAVVELLGLAPLLGRRPAGLSGGERQRVALGRALLAQPRLLLLDEPLAALDAPRRAEVLPYLEALRDELAIPMVYVSHQYEEVLRLATHIVLMDGGRVIAQGSPMALSLTAELRSIVGPEAAGSVLEAQVVRTEVSGLAELRLGAGTLRVSAPAGTQPGSTLRVQLLARDVILATESPHALSVRNALPGRIVSLTADGEDAVLTAVDIGGARTVLARVTRDAVDVLALAPGRPVWALVKAVSTRGHAFRLGAATRPESPSRSPS